jgi:hypothetical protein
MEILLDQVKGGSLNNSSGTKPSYSAQELADVLGEHVKLHGAGFFGDFWNGFKKVMSVAKPVLSAIPHPAAQGASGVLGALGMGKVKKAKATKKKGGAMSAGAETAGAMSAGAKTGGAETAGAMSAGAMSAGAKTGGSKKTGGAIKPSSDRKALIKEVMSKKGLSMIEASKHIKANNLYKKA